MRSSERRQRAGTGLVQRPALPAWVPQPSLGHFGHPQAPEPLETPLSPAPANNFYNQTLNGRAMAPHRLLDFDFDRRFPPGLRRPLPGGSAVREAL